MSGARAWWLVLVVACSGGSSGPATTTPVTVTPDPPAGGLPAGVDTTPPKLRLPDGVRPVRNTVELTLDPATEDFTGTITTELEITKPTSVVWLNAKEITVDTATFTAGGAQLPATVVLPGGTEFLGLVVRTPLAPGKATLAIAYRGKMHRNDGDGIYPAKEGNDWYLFTQFEALDARSAFPTFDEPSFKVPWQLTIHTKQELVALSNTEIEAETDQANGMKSVRFAETKPLPSYLVAFAVGPFEAVDAGKTRNGVPIRIVVAKGRSKEAGYPVQATRPVLDLLEDYFGMPYPYSKLDLIAVSVFNAGAMENPGLITFREQFILSKPEELTLAKQATYASIAAHELAHMWFGDYVTLAWWDDIWLNEAFANWMASKVIDQWKPEWDVPVEAVASKIGVMRTDGLDAARAIRQPIETPNDISNAFDGITYDKGQAVLAMMERWIGPDVFKQGVRDYLAAHAFGSATYTDFVGAMTKAAGKDLGPLFDAFVLQSGVPLVTFDLACGKGSAPTLKLTQRRYAPTGSKIDPNRTWQIPVCVRWGAGKTTGRDCMLLGAAAAELPLSSKTCPAWVMPNEGGAGYYHMLPTRPMLDALLARSSKVLTLPERVGLIGDVNALVGSGDVQNSVALALVATLAKDKNRHIVDASIGVIAGIDEMVPDNLRATYEKLIRKRYRARALELGWQSKKGEDDNLKLLRPSLLSLVAGIGKDPELIEQATALAWKWLDDHAAVQPELVPVVLGVAARYGDQKLFDRLYADAKKATERGERTRLLGAMGAFTDPAIVKQALALVLTDEFELRESSGLLQGGFTERRTRETTFAFVKDNFDKIVAKLPEPYRVYLAFTFVPLCDDARKPEIEAFFRPRIEKFEGGPRTMEQALEAMSLCSAARKAQTPGVVAFLKKQ
jgi:alanyl aminopeptidase